MSAASTLRAARAVRSRRKIEALLAFNSLVAVVGALKVPMKAEFDKEMDALLRRNAGAAGGRGARGREAPRASAHLDADELSAFAENALPTVARRGAASHLADCDECRGVVVGLARAAGPAGEMGKRAAAASVEGRASAPGRGWFAALFSPRVLRFVAPALALCLVAAAALVVLRGRRNSGSSVALRNQERDAARPAVVGEGAANAGTSAPANASANTSANVAAPVEDSNVTPAPAAPETRAFSAARGDESPDGSEGHSRAAHSQPPAEAEDKAGEAPPSQPAVTASAPAAGADAVQPPPPAPAAAPREAEKQAKEEQRSVADEEVARVDESQQERRVNQSGNAVNNVELNQQTPDGSRTKSANSTYGGRVALPPPARRAPERTNRSMNGPRAGGGGHEAEARERDAAAEPSGDTRSVGGRRYRREGGAWVDTNYRPSMSMTGVRRGTEAYRALVADIPELGRIAEQLGGEVVTVVRGRAYRIR